ncbi:TPA: Arm DNA-binding domain-containing protein [Citrobacter braakii]
MPPKEQKIINNQIIKSLDTRSKPYKFSIGRGLFLLVNPTGSKCWRMKYRIEGKEKSLTFGAWPDVTITEAIKLREEARTKLKDGYDPARDKAQEREQRRQQRARQSFQLSLSEHYSLTIKTTKQTLSLTPEQSQAVKAFLLSGGNNDAIN